MVASTLDQRSFAKYLTQSESKGAPAFCFTQYEFNVEEFLKQNANREMMHSPFPDTNPRRLYEYIMELRGHPEKTDKDRQSELRVRRDLVRARAARLLVRDEG